MRNVHVSGHRAFIGYAIKQNASLRVDEHADRFCLARDVFRLLVRQVLGVGQKRRFLCVVVGQLIQENNIEERLVHLDAAVVTDKTQ